MQSFIASVRVNITTVASLLTWMRSHGVEPGSTGTLIRLALEHLEQSLQRQGLAPQLTPSEAFHALEGYRFNVKGRGGRQGLLKQLQEEHITADGLNFSSDEQVRQITGLSAERLAEAQARVAERLAGTQGEVIKEETKS